MANQTWTFDAPTGVYKNHTMSSELRHAAIAETKFMQFVKPEPGYGKKKGESITISRVANIAVPTSAVLTEGVRIAEDVMTLSTVAITVSEWGRAIPYTSISDDLSEFDINNSIQRCLMDQMKLVMDNAACDAFQTAKIVYVPTGVAAGTFYTTGSAGTAALANMNVFHVEAIRDYMYKDLVVPPYEGDDYIGLISTKGKRGIMSDPAWEPWHKYTDPEAKYNSEIGRLENIRWIEINNTGALSNTLGTGSVLGEAIIFGADAVAMAVAQDPELRAKIPEDYGRSKGVAWYGILQFGLVWDTANSGEARVVHVSST